MPQVHLHHILERLLRTCVVFLVFQQSLAIIKFLLFIRPLLFNLIDLLRAFGLQRAFALCKPLPNLFGLIELAVLPELFGLLLQF